MSTKGDQWRSGFTTWWAFTDRFWLTQNQGAQNRRDPAKQRGSSGAPFDEFNLATHVGDEAAAVAANRSLLIDSIGGASGGTHVIGAAHSGNVAVVTEPGDRVTEGVDALVTKLTEVALLGLGADCAVVTFVDQRAGVIGVAHCGWQGLVNGIIPATVTAMIDQGAQREEISAQIGPSICGQCYEVAADRAAQVAAIVPDAVLQVGSRFGIDIAMGVAAQLSEQDVAATASSVCTFESPAHFSFRRDGTTGRQGAAIVMRAEGETEG